MFSLSFPGYSLQKLLLGLSAASRNLLGVCIVSLTAFSTLILNVLNCSSRCGLTFRPQHALLLQISLTGASGTSYKVSISCLEEFLASHTAVLECSVDKAT
jgi:hypothetical protein